ALRGAPPPAARQGGACGAVTMHGTMHPGPLGTRLGAGERAGHTTAASSCGGGRDKGIDVNRERAVDLAVGQIEEQFGKGAIMKLGEGSQIADIPALPTGSLGLDIALGIGGMPRGRVVEIYGPESSGKTTLALELIAEAQKRGGICAFVDAEHALDVGY